MDQADDMDDYNIARRRHELSGIIYELSSPDYQKKYWHGLGGDEYGFSAAYELIVEDYKINTDETTKENIGVSSEQWDSVKFLAYLMNHLMESCGYSIDNSRYTSHSQWEGIVEAAKSSFIILNVSK